MSWYTAECLYRSEMDDFSASEQLCEYRYFLVRADDDEAANDKAWELARRKQHTYLNENGIEVRWLLDEVVETKEVLAEELSEETEVYHRYFSRPLSTVSVKSL